MVWKIVLCAFLAVGVLAEFELTERDREPIKAMCRRNGAEDKIDQANAAVITFVDCIKGQFDPSTIKQEFMEAIHNYEGLKAMAKKYCPKIPQLKSCSRALITGVTPCLDQNTRKHMPDIINSNDQFLDFVCLNDGDKIASFFAEGGLECINSKLVQIQICAAKISAGIPSEEAANNLTLAQRCTITDEFTTCLVDALKGCATSTPANIVESLFQYTRIPECEKKDSNKI